ncbi:hypothetical protein [Falsiroseomonas sp. HW251]|uniref:hypothetical protein n=1 Tax=Falsiroseomonas sp. HW251 TaxID=3390998 RepID=UPI003D3127CE
MFSLFLAVMLTCLGVWMQVLCDTVLQAVGTRRSSDWSAAGLIALSPFFPIAAAALS